MVVLAQHGYESCARGTWLQYIVQVILLERAQWRQSWTNAGGGGMVDNIFRAVDSGAVQDVMHLEPGSGYVWLVADGADGGASRDSR